MNNWSGGHENTGCLCDITNSFYYKQAEHSTAPKIKLMRRADNKGDQKIMWSFKRQLSNSSCSGLLKKSNPNRRYHPEPFLSPISIKVVANAKEALLVQLSKMQNEKKKSNKKKAVEKLGSSKASEQFSPSYRTSSCIELCTSHQLRDRSNLGHSNHQSEFIF